MTFITRLSIVVAITAITVYLLIEYPGNKGVLETMSTLHLIVFGVAFYFFSPYMDAIASVFAKGISGASPKYEP